MHDRLGDEISAETCGTLIRSIQKHGQKHPALGRLLPPGSGYEVELIYGARRLFVARHLGIDLLVEIRGVDDRGAIVEMDIENRVRLDISPYERGLSYKQWLRRGFFRNQSEMARGLNISEAQVSRLLRYADLPAVVVAAFETPRDIREEWAGALARKCAEPTTREEVLRRARRYARRGERLPPQRVFDLLMEDADKPIVSARARDEIVKDVRGRPLMRVSVRAKTVHLIVQRERLTPVVLSAITQGIKEALDEPTLIPQN